ncbi:MAG: sigma-70 family RNA polymerase sigma factor [Eubacterium sp.]|nr:sigma-70 family RNA polymerase sigma factor [Eubacterium sp.]
MAIVNFDKQVFDNLYQKYSSMIFRTSYNFLLNKEDAEDIVQEVFIKYFISNKKFNDSNHEKAWILKVTANLCKNALRSKHRQNLQLDDTIKIIDNTFEKSRDDHIDLENTLSKLSANQRLAVYLFYYEQIPIKDIAKIMKSNENTVKSYLSRSKSKMKIYLEKE